MKKGQLALENLFLMGMILLLVGALFYYSMGYTVTNYRQRQADDTLHSLLLTANAVHELGPGSRENAMVNIPEDINLKVKERLLSALDSSGDINNTVDTPFDVIGTIPPSEGLTPVTVKAVNDTLVKIGKWTYLISISPNPANWSTFPNRIWILGEDMDNSVILLVNGVSYAPAPFVHINSSYVAFIGNQTMLYTPPGEIRTFQMSINDSYGVISNTLPLYVRGPGM